MNLWHSARKNFDRLRRRSLSMTSQVMLWCWRFFRWKTVIKLNKTVFFASLTCDKKNLKWIFISYGVYETCVFISPRQRLGDIKTRNSFHKYLWNENSFQILYIYILLGEWFKEKWVWLTYLNRSGTGTSIAQSSYFSLILICPDLITRLWTWPIEHGGTRTCDLKSIP